MFIRKRVTLFFCLAFVTLFTIACASGTPTTDNVAERTTESAPPTEAIEEAEEPTAEPAEAETEEPTAEPAEGAEAPGEGEADTGGWPRTIAHATGDTTLDALPERIVALEWTYAEDLLSLGVQPAGVADIEGYNLWVSVEPALDASVVDVGTRQEPSLEAIAELDPDLIIGVQFRHEAIYEDLSSIAPTLLFNPYPEDLTEDQFSEMETTFRTIAEATGREEQAGEVLAEMHSTFQEVAATLAEGGHEGHRAVLVQAFSSGEAPQLRLFTDNAMAIRIMEEIGLENGWPGEPDIYGFNTVGVEALPEIGDAYFFYVVQENDDVFANQLAGNPVWEGLEFVQSGNTYPLGGDTWLFGGPRSAELLAHQIANALE